MREQLHTQIVHRQLTCSVQQVILAVAQEKDAHDHCQILQGVRAEAGEVTLTYRVVNGLFDDERTGELEQRQRRQKQHGGRHTPEVGADVAPESPNEPTVVSLAKHQLFVHDYSASSRSSSSSS